MSTSKKILHVITGLGPGGAEGALFRLCRFDKKNQHSIISLTSADHYVPWLVQEGFTVRSMNLVSVRQLPRALLRLVRIIRAEKPDVIQTWMYHADLLGGLAAVLAGNLKVCWGIRHSYLEHANTKTSTLLVVRMLAILSWLIPKRIILCASNALETHVALGFKESKMQCVPNGYEFDKYYPDQARKVAGMAPVIGMVGRFHPDKDFENLFRALAILRACGVEFEAVLAGTGVKSSNDRIIDLLGCYDLLSCVRLVGFCKDIPVFMRALDLYVLSSASEAFPNVVAEAMACGTPCVVTDVGDAAIIVGDTGWVVPAKDPNKLAEAISIAIKTLADKVTRERLSKECTNRIRKKYGLDRMVNAYDRIWQQICDGL